VEERRAWSVVHNEDTDCLLAHDSRFLDRARPLRAREAEETCMRSSRLLRCRRGDHLVHERARILKNQEVPADTSLVERQNINAYMYASGSLYTDW